MTVRDVLISVVKTVVQVIVAALLTWVAPILDWVTAQGFEIDRNALGLAVFMLLVGLVTGAVNEAGRRWPIVNRLLSFGLSDGGPTYGGKDG